MYVLNTKKGTTIKHPQIGELRGGFARPIEDEHIPMAKCLINVVIFEGIEE